MTYRVVTRWGDKHDYALFSDALAHYSREPGASEPINLERYDGSEDGNHSGLGAAEKEAVERADNEYFTRLTAARGPWCERCGEREEPACWDGRCVGA